MVNVQSTLHINVAHSTLAALELVFYAVVPLSLPLWKLYVCVSNKIQEKKQSNSKEQQQNNKEQQNMDDHIKDC